MAHQGLSKRIETLTPRTVYRASSAMNAAFAQFAAELVGREELVRPYRGTAFEGLGARLRQLNPSDRGHQGDREAADGWAAELGLTNWYGWRKV